MFWKNTKPSSAKGLETHDLPVESLESRSDQELDEDQELCLICVDLASWNVLRKDRRQVVKPAVATHGAGGQGYGWKACFEHYEVVTTLSRLVMTGKMDVVFYNPHEEKRRKAREREAYEDYDENCGCQRCMHDSGRSIWYEIICNQCHQSACLRTSDHRLSCGLPLPWPEVVAP